MRIQHVGLEWVPLTWPLAAPHLERALQFAGGDYTLEHAQALVAGGTWLLIVAVDDAGTIRGAATVSLYNRPADRVAFITALGGRGIINRDSLTQLKLLVASFGATCVEAATRPAVARLLSRVGFEQKYITVGVKL